MQVLAWWLIPIGATVLALIAMAWRGRTSKPVDAHDGMADLERFRQAMEKPLPALRVPTKPRRGRSDSDPEQSADTAA